MCDECLGKARMGQEATIHPLGIPQSQSMRICCLHTSCTAWVVSRIIEQQCKSLVLQLPRSTRPGLRQVEALGLKIGLAMQGKVVKRKSRFATEAGAEEDTPDESPTGEALPDHTMHQQALLHLLSADLDGAAAGKSPKALAARVGAHSFQQNVNSPETLRTAERN